MKKLLTSTLLAGLLGATAALASGPVAVPAPAPAQIIPAQPEAHDWSGAYMGLGLGYARASVSTGGGAPGYPDASGGVGSVIAGYNWQRGTTVYGLEGVATFSRLSDSAACTGGPGTCATTIDNFAAIRGRLGFTQGRTLFFATAGIATDGRSFTHNAPPATTVGGRFNGGVIGVGIEHALGRGDWSARGDLEHYFYAEQTLGGGTYRPSANVVRFSLVRRF